MITSISVRNFRVFSDVTWPFELPRLAVLCGTNSAGKSTLLKVPLLLRQSMSTEMSSSTQGRLRFVGPQVDLGSFEALVSDNDLTKTLGIGLSVEGGMSADSIDWLESLSESKKRTHRRQRKNPPIESYELQSFFEFGSSEPDVGSEGGVRDHKLLSARFELVARDQAILKWSISLVEGQEDGEYQMVLPGAFYRTELTGYGALSISRLEPEATKTADLVPVGVSLRGLLPDAIRANIEAPGLLGEQIKLPLPVDISRPLAQLEESLDGVHYLGPLRTPAERFYVASEDAAPVFDPSGDFVPYVLRDRANEQVEVVKPEGDEVQTLPLTRAIGLWLHYLRTGESEDGDASPELVVEATRGVLVELSLHSSSGGQSHPLADSGFGYSQVLPIIIRGLLASEGDTVIVEQPELHLHPALQVRIAMFLVALARSGRQIIAETHSEHVVNTIRVCAAEDKSGQVAALSRIVYLDGKESPPLLHQLEIGEDGTVPEWPREFFGEAIGLSSRLLRAQRIRKDD